MNSSIILAILLFVLVVIFWLFMAYNGFKRMKNSSEEAFRAITLCYEARRKTTESLVRLMKNYINHEDDILNDITDLVATARDAVEPAEIIKAEMALVNGIMAMTEVAENYDDFAASKRYCKLKAEMDLDDRNIAATIKIYNTIAKTYNEKVHGIMTRFAAKLCGFKDIPMI